MHKPVALNNSLNILLFHIGSKEDHISEPYNISFFNESMYKISRGISEHVAFL